MSLSVGTHGNLGFDIFPMSTLLQNSATGTPCFQDRKKKSRFDHIISFHFISYTFIHYLSLFPQENLSRPTLPRHLPAPAPFVALPHPLLPARGGGGRSGAHQPRLWARRSKHRKRHLDGSPPRNGGRT